MKLDSTESANFRRSVTGVNVVTDLKGCGRKEKIFGSIISMTKVRTVGDVETMMIPHLMIMRTQRTKDDQGIAGGLGSSHNSFGNNFRAFGSLDVSLAGSEATNGAFHGNPGGFNALYSTPNSMSLALINVHYRKITIQTSGTMYLALSYNWGRKNRIC